MSTSLNESTADTKSETSETASTQDTLLVEETTLNHSSPEPQETGKTLRNRNNKSQKTNYKLFTREEVKKHNKRNDVWLIINNSVYDASDFCASHPGGEFLILDVGGRDVTDPFLANHMPAVVEKYLPMLKIGELSDPVEPREEVKRYRGLFKKFQDEGWFQTDYNDYYPKFALYI